MPTCLSIYTKLSFETPVAAAATAEVKRVSKKSITRLLLVEDNLGDARLLCEMLNEQALLKTEVTHVECIGDAEKHLAEQAVDVILLDLDLPDPQGLGAIRRVHAAAPRIPVVVLANLDDEPLAAQALQEGAQDYLIKGQIETRGLQRALRHAIERNICEEALRGSELRFRQLAETIRDVFFIQDLTSSRMFYVSPAYEEVWGRTCRSLYANPASWADSIHPDDLSYAFTKFSEGQNTGFDYEFRIIRPDGDVRWIHVRGFPILNDAGKPYRTAGVATDVTQRKHGEEELRRSESLKSAILKSSLDCLITIDHEGQIVEFNPAAEAAFGFTREQALGKPMAELIVPPRLRGAHRRGFAHYLATGEGPILGKRLELHAIRADGTEFPIELTIAAIGAASAPLFTGFIRDITARKDAEEKIKRLNRVYAVLSGINSLIVRVRERDELFRESCRLIVEAGRFSLAWIAVADRETKQLNPVAWHGVEHGFVDLVRDRLSLKNPPAEQSIHVRAVTEKRAVVSNDVRDDPQIKFKKEHAQFNSRSVGVFPIVVGDDVAAVLVLHFAEAGFFDDDEMKLLLDLSGDIAFALEHIEKSEQVNYLAYYDVLTGLANRTLFRERLEQKLISTDQARGKVAVFLLDLDRFKAINDALGRHAGDEVLKQVAHRLVSVGGDATRFARIGADHFAIFSTDVENEQQVARYTEHRLRSVFDPPYRVGGQELRVGTKCGIAMFPADGADADTLLRNAEAALERAKSSGERYVFFAEEMTERVAEKLTLENKLRQALEKEEFVLHYQPKVDLENRSIVGVEALIRWQSPELGLVLPLEFIPLLEETGLILQVGIWALKRAVLDHCRWVEQKLKAPRVAVNVSQIQLRQRDFVQLIERAIIGDVVPTGIDLEITESLVMEDIESNIEKLKSVRRLGVRIAIDDFGTGYSSLAYLAKLPLETLKIDRVFISTMLDDPASATLVQTMISLAHSLRLRVVAEGVETEEQAKMLQRLHCDEMQGYLFSKPVPFDVLTAQLKKSQSETTVQLAY
jgi:diguanylate cyclase (GGDEF)-like protein/PAS domain S-box-containing protein